MKQFAEFCLDTAEECLWRHGARIAMAPKPFAVLRYLVEKAGHLVTHDELLDALWPETYVQPQVLRTYMLDLRKVLGDDAREPRFIESLPKRGYRFVAPVRDATAPQAAQPSFSPSSPPQLTGRASELLALEKHLQQARNGIRQIVFLKGEAGIGKTALLETFCRHAGTVQEVLVGSGQCLQGFARRQDYYPALEALAQICKSPIAREHLSRRAPGWLSETVPGDGSIPVVRAPGNLCAALEAIAQDIPLVLAFEDLQWADEATLELISALAHRRGAAKLMLLATYTEPVPAAAHGLRALTQDLSMRHLAAEIPVSRLNKTTTAKLLGARFGADISAGLVDLVHMRSEGNPLIAIAIMDHFVSEGLLAQNCGSGEWQLRGASDQAETDVPRELAQMIELELERMDPRERRLLEAGSLISIAFPAWAVAAALGQDLAETEEACDEIARRYAFVKRAGLDELPDGTQSNFYVFAHGLYREALYQRQPAARRAERHVRIADRLRSLFPGRQELIAEQAAMHYEAACDWRRALEVLRTAEKQARSRHAEILANDLRYKAARMETLWKTRSLDSNRSDALCG